MRHASIAFALLVAWSACTAQEPAQDPVKLREAAASAEARSDFGAAADRWLALVAAEPQRAEWAVAAGRCLGRAGRFNDAVDLLDRKRREFPGVLELPAMLARTHLLQAENDRGVIDATSHYRRAAETAADVLRHDADHLDAALILAQARFMLGDAEATAAAVQYAVERHPDHPGPHLLAGRMALERFREAHRALAALAQDPAADQTAIAAELGKARELAVKSFERALAIDPERNTARLMLAEIAARDGDRRQAVAQMTAALAIDPDAAVQHAWLEEQLSAAERAVLYRNASTAYRARAGAAPDKAATLSFFEARALHDAGDHQAALPLFEQVLAQNPRHVNAAWYAMLGAYALQDFDRAERHGAAYARHSAVAFADTMRALHADLRGEVAAIVTFLADRAWQAGRRDESRDLNHVIACFRDSADAWNNYAFLCRESGRFDESLRAYRAALDKEPDSPQLLNDCGVVLQYHLTTPENLQEARRLYERAITLARALRNSTTISEIDRQRAIEAQRNAELNLAKLPSRQ